MCIRYWRSCRPSACLYVCYVDNGRKIRYDTSYTRKTEQTLCVYVFSSCTKIDFTLPFRICSNELLLMSSALASMRFNSNWLNFWFLSFFEDLWTWLANDLRNEKKNRIFNTLNEYQMIALKLFQLRKLDVLFNKKNLNAISQNISQ